MNQRDQEFNDRIVALAKQAKLDSWNSFVRELPLPAEIMPALQTGRPELLVLAQPRPMNADEVGAMFKLVGGLIETMFALREHAEELHHLARDLRQQYSGTVRLAEKIEQFAGFEHEQLIDDDERQSEASA